MMHERHFKAMGTDVGIWLWSTHPDAGASLDSLPGTVEQAEQELSRFRRDSGVCKLNTRAGKGPQAVSQMLADVCELALQAARSTAGLFDPTILPALLAAGYDGTFSEVAAASKAGKKRALAPPASRPKWEDIVVGRGTVSLPPHAAIDLGGLAKGWIVDLLAEALRPFGPALVDAGGDVRATGKAAGLAWPVAVADPSRPERDLAQVELCDEAVATSSIGKRRWLVGQEWMHHIIDPRTQLPAATDLLCVTVLGDSARAAEVHAKVALLLGSEAGAAHLEAHGASALLVSQDGTVRTLGERLVRANSDFPTN